MAPPCDQHQRSELALLQVPEARQQTQRQQRFQEQRTGAVEVQRLELDNVLHVIGVAEILDDVSVQMPGIRIHEAGTEASGRSERISPGVGESGLPRLCT